MCSPLPLDKGLETASIKTKEALNIQDKVIGEMLTKDFRKWKINV